jgi:chromosomal replication initiation ATPase DnaA
MRLHSDESLIEARDEIIADVLATFGADDVMLDEVSSAHRSSPRAAHYRHIAMWVHWWTCHCTQAETAWAFGRDPSTVCHALIGIRRRMHEDPVFQYRIASLILRRAQALA